MNTIDNVQILGNNIRPVLYAGVINKLTMLKCEKNRIVTNKILCIQNDK